MRFQKEHRVFVVSPCEVRVSHPPGTSHVDPPESSGTSVSRDFVAFCYRDMIGCIGIIDHMIEFNLLLSLLLMFAHKVLATSLQPEAFCRFTMNPLVSITKTSPVTQGIHRSWKLCGKNWKQWPDKFFTIAQGNCLVSKSKCGICHTGT